MLYIWCNSKNRFLKKEGMYMEVQHRGWNWEEVTSESWKEVSEEFLPISLQWMKKYHKILDIGAGRGRHSFLFSEKGIDVTAVDLSEDGIEYIKNEAEKRKLKMDAIVCDMTSLPFPNNSFDAVVCFHAIYHTDYNGIRKALKEIHRVLKDKGEAYITFNTKENPKYRIEDAIDGYTVIEKEGIEAGIPHCYLDLEDVYQLLSDFRILSLNKIYNIVRNETMLNSVHFYAHIRVDK